MFLDFSLSPALLCDAATNRVTLQAPASLRLLAASLLTASFFCVFADSRTVAAAASLVFATCNSEL